MYLLLYCNTRCAVVLTLKLIGFHLSIQNSNDTDQINFDQHFLVFILVVIGFLCHQALLSRPFCRGPFVEALLSRPFCRGPYVEVHLSRPFCSGPFVEALMSQIHYSFHYSSTTSLPVITPSFMLNLRQIQFQE